MVFVFVFVFVFQHSAVGVISKLAMIIIVSGEEGLRNKFRQRSKATRRLTGIVLSRCNGVKKEKMKVSPVKLVDGVSVPLLVDHV